MHSAMGHVPYNRFLHYRFSSQNRRARVRTKDRLFSRSSVTAPVPDDEETIGRATPPHQLEGLIQPVSVLIDSPPAINIAVADNSAIKKKKPAPLDSGTPSPELDEMSQSAKRMSTRSRKR